MVLTAAAVALFTKLLMMVSVRVPALVAVPAFSYLGLFSVTIANTSVDVLLCMMDHGMQCRIC